MLRPNPSNLPRPRSFHGETNIQLLLPPSEGPSNDLARRRQAKKDETIRKKLEQEISRQTGKKFEKPLARAACGTVGNLRPLPAITLAETATASEAARHMAVKRADAVLVTDEDDQLTGIVTDKDLAFRVLAEGLDPRSTCLGDIMTQNPCTVTTMHNATDALNKMVAGGFRHLPVTDHVSEDIVGMLDITECLLDALAKLERANKSTKQLSDVLDTMSDFDAAHNKEVAVYVKALREQLGFPKLSSILDPSKPPSEVSIRTNVRDAARIMKECHKTATLVLDEGKPVGIFTSKDLVVRVMAMGLDPTITSTVRVMTPSPDMASPDTTILDALRKMHGGHYQHLPLLDKDNAVVGVVDILQLTYTTLNTLKTMQTQDGDGPVWNKFWNAMSMEEISDSTENRTNGSIDNPSIRNLSTPATSPSSTIDGLVPSSKRRFSSPVPKIDEDTFTFKFTDPDSSKTHRFHAPCKDLNLLFSAIRSKMCLEHLTELMVSYIDDEGDKIVLGCNEDLVASVSTARKAKWNLIRLVVDVKPAHDKPETPSTKNNNNNINNNSNKNTMPALEYLVVSGGSFGAGFAVGAILMWALLRSK